MGGCLADQFALECHASCGVIYVWQIGMVGSNLEAKLEGRKMERVYTTSLIFNSGT